MKKCIKCKQVKLIDNFYINNTNTDCLDSACSECRRKQRRENYLNKKKLLKVLTSD